jgi:hypothetical protein
MPAVLLTGLCVAAGAPAATLVRGPYLQLPGPDRMTVVWKTDAPERCGLSLRLPDGAQRTIAGEPGRRCIITVDGLTPGVRYGYVPLADGAPVDEESAFRTADPAGPFAFLVVGDSGCGCGAQRAVAEQMQAVPADFILHTGDMVYREGAAEDFDPKLFTPYRALLRRLVLWPTLGNHDVRAADGAAWRAAFFTPANNRAGSEDYYSFDHGNLHVAVLNSNAGTAPDSPQYAFLQGDLEATRARWKVVVLHHTLYSSGTRHGSNVQIRASLMPLFDRHGVDLVFMGHDHDYERTHPLRADRVVADGAGTVYVTSGGGGAGVRAVGRSPFTAYAESSFHFVRVAVHGDRLAGTMIRDDGAVGDRFALVKDAASGPRRADGAPSTLPPPGPTPHGRASW